MNSQYDKEHDEIIDAYNRGEITHERMRQELRDLRREYQDAYRERDARANEGRGRY